MDIIKSVFEISEQILSLQPSHAWIRQIETEKLAEQMKEDGCPSFYDSDGGYQ